MATAQGRRRPLDGYQGGGLHRFLPVRERRVACAGRHSGGPRVVWHLHRAGGPRRGGRPRDRRGDGGITRPRARLAGAANRRPLRERHGHRAARGARGRAHQTRAAEDRRDQSSARSSRGNGTTFRDWNGRALRRQRRERRGRTADGAALAGGYDAARSRLLPEGRSGVRRRPREV